MKFTREIANKINSCSVFGMRLFKKYRLGTELARLSKQADLTELLCEQYEKLASDIDVFFAKSDRCRFARLFEIDGELKKIKFRLGEIEHNIDDLKILNQNYRNQ